MQALDTWDSFPLFQLLNDYLRSDGEEGGGRGQGRGGREGEERKGRCRPWTRGIASLSSSY